jgi:hypothetical protein
MKVTDQQLEKLAPYIAGSMPDARGEMEMFCPVHPDSRKSASLNLNMGVWYCHAGCGGSSLSQLIDAEDTWVPMESRADISIGLRDRLQEAANDAMGRPENLLKKAKEWYDALQEEEGQQRRLYNLRGINRTTIRRHKIGFDGRYFKIPIFAPTPEGAEREIWNVRTYDPSPRFGRRKIWGTRGMNRARIYPAHALDWCEDGDSIIICEGEWDTLLCLQAGFLAVTTTSGAGKPWNRAWDIAFAGLRVFLCADADKQGQKQNQIIGRALDDIADVYECELPYPIEEDHGKDLTDLLIHQDDPVELLAEVLYGAEKFKRKDTV